MKLYKIFIFSIIIFCVGCRPKNKKNIENDKNTELSTEMSTADSLSIPSIELGVKFQYLIHDPDHSYLNSKAKQNRVRIMYLNVADSESCDVYKFSTDGKLTEIEGIWGEKSTFFLPIMKEN